MSLGGVCYVCGSEIGVQARLIPYQCRVVTLCRLCSLKGVTQVIFKCACGKYDFLAKYPHRLKILAERLKLSPATLAEMSQGLALVESTTCKFCQPPAASVAV